MNNSHTYRMLLIFSCSELREKKFERVFGMSKLYSTSKSKLAYIYAKLSAWKFGFWSIERYSSHKIDFFSINFADMFKHAATK
jgi:hypothetical protein